MAQHKQAPTASPPDDDASGRRTGAVREPMPLTQEEVDALRAGTADSASLARAGDASEKGAPTVEPPSEDHATGDATREVKATPTATPPG